MATNAQAIDALESALVAGRTVTIRCSNSDVVTVGPHTGNNYGFEALRWGRSRFALPSGKSISWAAQAYPVAYEVVQECGRGNVSQALATP